MRVAGNPILAMKTCNEVGAGMRTGGEHGKRHTRSRRSGLGWVSIFRLARSTTEVEAIHPNDRRLADASHGAIKGTEPSEREEMPSKELLER